jgi:hypothetical protein
MAKHTGKIRHGDMTSLPCGTGKPDPHASAAHHAANKAAGLGCGMCCDDEAGENGAKSQHGGEGMASNAKHHDGKSQGKSTREYPE